MAKSYTYSNRDMEKMLKKNGYECIRIKGSHQIYSNGEKTTVVPCRLNKMLALRIIKQCGLIV